MIWLNGKMIAVDDARVAPNDRGFLLADGLFETLRVDAGSVIQLQDHLDRLRHGMSVLDIAITYDDQQLSDAMIALLETNDLSDA